MPGSAAIVARDVSTYTQTKSPDSAAFRESVREGWGKRVNGSTGVQARSEVERCPFRVSKVEARTPLDVRSKRNPEE